MKKHRILKFTISIFLFPFYVALCIFAILIYSAFALAWELIKLPFTSNKPMTGVEYENAVAGYLRRQGYWGVKTTKASGDYGVDIVAHRGGHKYAIQCKYYSSPVGVGAVQEVAAGKAMYGCDKAIVITNSDFTSAAQNLASTNGVKLMSHVMPMKTIYRKRNKVLDDKKDSCVANEKTPPTAPKTYPIQKDAEVKEAVRGVSVEYLIQFLPESAQYCGFANTIATMDRITTPMIQRKCECGYATAARIIDSLLENKLIETDGNIHQYKWTDKALQSGGQMP